jgi:hypothetical protein
VSVFYHRLEDFLVHFEFHANKPNEIPKSAVQSSATPQEKFSQRHTFPCASTLALQSENSQSSQLADSSGFSENSTTLQGG